MNKVVFICLSYFRYPHNILLGHMLTLTCMGIITCREAPKSYKYCRNSPAKERVSSFSCHMKLFIVWLAKEESSSIHASRYVLNIVKSSLYKPLPSMTKKQVLTFMFPPDKMSSKALP